MNIFTAKTAGFCPGVANAIRIAESVANGVTAGVAGHVTSGGGSNFTEFGLFENSNNPPDYTPYTPYTLGELIHNARETQRLRGLGVKTADTVAELPDDAYVVIRSHGVPRIVYDELTRRGIRYADATCPKVARIHDIVRTQVAGGGYVIVAGKRTHPEVAGIVGCVNTANIAVAENITELAEYYRLYKDERLAVVAQTTFDSERWAEFRAYFEAKSNIKIYDTICKATYARQREAAQMCEYCDIMVVVGDRHSSNTAKLYDICLKRRPTYFVGGACDINKLRVPFAKAIAKIADTKIGIIAGASAPAYIIEEVRAGMSEFLEVDKSEMSAGDLEFLEMVDKTVKKIFTGKRVRATVDEVRDDDREVIVNIGTKHSGYIPADELSDNKNAKPSDLVKVGDEFECVVTSINDNDGVVWLSKRKVDSAVGFEKCLKAYDTNGILEGTVSGVVNGGVIIVYEGARVFIPASQSGVSRAGKLEELKGGKYPFKVIEINEQRSRVVGSIRQAKNEGNAAVREKFWNEVEVGQKFVGEVKSMESYGAFVDLGGVDGMVHLSELSWNRIRHPRDVVSVGDKLAVYVKGFDKEKRRVSLGAKDPAGNPWEKFLSEFHIGDIVKVQIVNLAAFGAFAQIIPGIDGLIHISQITQKRVTDVSTVLSIGQIVNAKITDIEQDKNRVSLSMKATIEDGYSDILDEMTEVDPEELDDDIDDDAGDVSDAADAGDVADADENTDEAAEADARNADAT